MKFTIFSAQGSCSEFVQPVVMAILNATPDSFSDGGDLDGDEQLEQKVEQILESDTKTIDIGGESTRPGHEKIDAQEESRRVVRVVGAVRKQSSKILISIDTQKAAVAKAALDARADFINDISSLSDPAMAQVINDAGCSLVVMRNTPLQTDLIESCKKQIRVIVSKTESQGIDQDKLIIDPGLGFGNLAEQNYSKLPGGDLISNLKLIDQMSEYSMGLPVLIGASRKRFVGELMGQQSVEQRDGGSVALAVFALQRGASIVRVHNPSATVQAKSSMMFSS